MRVAAGLLEKSTVLTLQFRRCHKGRPPAVCNGCGKLVTLGLKRISVRLAGCKQGCSFAKHGKNAFRSLNLPFKRVVAQQDIFCRGSLALHNRHIGIAGNNKGGMFLEYFRSKGLRILQLTHNESNAHATAYTDERSGKGLSALGADGVREMNRIGLIPDVSHASEQTALQTVELSTTPVILSHGACRALLNHPRAATDRMIKAIADNGGIFSPFMMSFWLTTDPVPKPEHYVAHIRHAVNLGGIDTVGVANDYPMEGLQFEGRPFNNETDTAASYGAWWEGNRARGVPGFGPTPTHAVIPEFNNIDRLALIHRALLKGGFKPREADKIMGGNWARFFKENLR